MVPIVGRAGGSCETRTSSSPLAALAVLALVTLAPAGAAPCPDGTATPSLVDPDLVVRPAQAACPSR